LKQGPRLNHMAKELRPYQVQLKHDIYDAWRASYSNVLAQMPTGLGKTVLFSTIAKEMAIDSAQKNPTAIMVHRKELVQQISLTLADEAITHNIIAPRSTILGIVGAHRRVLGRQFYDHNGLISVVSVDTLVARIKKNDQWIKNWAQKIRLWITDEAAHLLKDNKWGRAVAHFPNAIGLGVTATPRRLDKRGLGRHADGVFDTMVEGPSTRWGIQNGFLCPYKIAIPPSDYRNFLKRATAGADFSKEAMIDADRRSHIIGDVLEAYKRFALGKQSILFSAAIETGREMEKKFNSAGIPAKLLTGETPDGERLEALLAFRNKKIQQLINVDLFDEGLDVPGIECVQIARPTMSTSKFLQMVGRGLRPQAGKEFLILIDHVGNVNEHGLPDARRAWTLDRIVNRRNKTNFMRVCSNIECNAPYDRALTVCPHCGTEAVSSGGGGGGGGRIPPIQVDGDLELIDPETLHELAAKAVLEDPARVAQRVSHTAGPAAGKKALKSQQERIDTQHDLVNVIARWAGMQKHYGYSDRSIHKLFYITYDQTITEALSEPRAEMLETIDQLEQELQSWERRKGDDHNGKEKS
jgi:DNA repair protein RadD